MARLNLDDQFWIDCMGIVAAIGDQDKAIGQAVRFFRMAQEKHKQGKLISDEDFVRAGFDDSLIGVFADRVDGGFQAVGAQKHFGWLAKRVEAGRKGGLANPSKPKQTKAKRTKVEQVEASPSYSSSPSSSRTSSSSLEEKKDENPTDSKPQAFIAAYCESFKSRWGTNPQIQGKDAGIAGRLAKGMTLERFKDLLDAYFGGPDAYWVKAKHPLNIFELKLNEVVVYADSGKFTTTREAQQADGSATNALLLQKVQRGEI